MVNLKIHLRQRFLDVLHVLARHLHQFAPMPGHCTYSTYVCIRPEGGPQQSHRMQVLQPLALMPVGSLSRHVFHMPRIGQTWPDPVRFQHVV
jgi:hypothetical protein